MKLRWLIMCWLLVSSAAAVLFVAAVASGTSYAPLQPWARLLRHSFGQPWGLVLPALVPGVFALQLWNAARRRRVLSRLGSVLAIESLLAVRRVFGVLRDLAMLLGLTLLGIGVAAPKWGGDEEQPTAPGRDLIVVLDCSRSMTAENPSRFERARKALLNLCDTVQKRGGHRLGLVVFAGQPELVCPLTHDYDYFRSTLQYLDPNVFLADLATEHDGEDVFGTRIGAALKKAVESHDELHPETADILLLSDGDDPSESRLGKEEWQDGIAAAQEQGIPIYTVGVGDPSLASTIPGGDGVLMYQDEEVHTRLQEKPLQEIAADTGGKYFPARTRSLPLGTIYLETIATKPVREVLDDKVRPRREHYVVFLFPAFLLFALAVALPDRLPALPWWCLPLARAVIRALIERIFR